MLPSSYLAFLDNFCSFASSIRLVLDELFKGYRNSYFNTIYTLVLVYFFKGRYQICTRARIYQVIQHAQDLLKFFALFFKGFP